jgi:bleomycin hydrolase
MAVNVIEKYGLVPQDVYPDAFNSRASRVINSVITRKLRESVPQLRRLASAAAATEKDDLSDTTLRKFKAQVLREIHSALVLSLGPPPSPNEEFTWEYADKENKVQSITTTPLAFYHDNVGFKATDHFSLVNDPRNDYFSHLTVDRLGNVVAGGKVSYVNVDIDILKQTAIKMIKKGIPVFFGADVGMGMDKSNGILSTEVFQYELGFNITLRGTSRTSGSSDADSIKRDNLLYNISKMNHAMVFTGVHLNADGEPQRWRVENSWGDASGKGGYYVMTDEWFTLYVYQVVTSRDWVEKKVSEVLDSEPKVLPLWDPMGALA